MYFTSYLPVERLVPDAVIEATNRGNQLANSGRHDRRRSVGIESLTAELVIIDSCAEGLVCLSNGGGGINQQVVRGNARDRHALALQISYNLLHLVGRRRKERFKLIGCQILVILGRLW